MEHVPPSGVCDTKLQQTQHLGETQRTETCKGHHKEVRVPRRTCFVSNPHVLLKPPLQLWCEPSTPAALEPDTKSHVLPLGKKSALHCRGETAEPHTASPRRFQDRRMGQERGLGGGEGRARSRSPGRSAFTDSVGAVSGKPWRVVRRWNLVHSFPMGVVQRQIS